MSLPPQVIHRQK